MCDNSHSQKSLLLIFRHPPFESNRNKDSLDIALACSAFDIPVSILFLNDAILQVTNKNDATKIAQKNLSNTFKVLEMYDIDNCYVIDEDLIRFNLTKDDLVINCETMNNCHLGSFIRNFSTVINL